MKQRLQGILIGLLIASIAFGTINVLATTNTRTIDVVDGVRQDFAEDMLPFISDTRTFLPVRGIAYALGLDVEWDEDTSTVYLTSPVVVADVPPTTESQTTAPPVTTTTPTTQEPTTVPPTTPTLSLVNLIVFMTILPLLSMREAT